MHVSTCLLPSGYRLGSGNDDTAFSYIWGFTVKGKNWKAIKSNSFPMRYKIMKILHSCRVSNKKNKNPQEDKEKQQE